MLTLPRIPAPSGARMIVLALVFVAVAGLAQHGMQVIRGTGYQVMFSIVTATFFGVGMATWRLRPANSTGLLLMATALVMLPPFWSQGELPAAVRAVGYILGGGLLWIPLTVLVLRFPFDRFDWHGDRWLVAAMVFNVTIQYWPSLPFKDGLHCDDCRPNPLGFSPDDGVIAGFENVDLYVSSVLALTVLTRIVQRVRRGSPPARRAMAPVLWTALPLPLLVIAYPLGLVPLFATHVATALVPLGFLAGLLRTRVTRTNVGELVVALSQAPPPDRLREILARALGDPSLRLAFRTDDGFIDASGSPIAAAAGQVATELPEAVLFHDPALLEDEGLVDTVAAAARLALENARLQAEVRAQLEEVRASRARVVESADAERRRIERDLHDGAQQQLLGLALSLRLLREELGEEASAGASALLEQASAEARRTLVEMRELARGIHPPVLVNDGLGPALETLAERAAVPVQVDATPEARLPPQVEVAAWFVCSECVANAAKHGHASLIRISAVQQDDCLCLRVQDDGIGGAALPLGGGLNGLRDRVEALGGSLGVSSPIGEGTTVTAVLPLAGAGQRRRYGMPVQGS